jgi:hypothetical protein
MPRARLLRVRWSHSTGCARAKMAKFAARRLFTAAVGDALSSIDIDNVVWLLFEI